MSKHIRNTFRIFLTLCSIRDTLMFTKYTSLSFHTQSTNAGFFNLLGIFIFICFVIFVYDPHDSWFCNNIIFLLVLMICEGFQNLYTCDTHFKIQILGFICYDIFVFSTNHDINITLFW
jgi:hypothetical protein